MKLIFGCDHAALRLKNVLIAYAREAGHEVEDVGTYTTDSVDYSDYAVPVCEAVAKGEAERGILVCFTGIGISIAANKMKGIRCALCGDSLSARLCRQHNDSNVLALGAGITGDGLAKEILDIWLQAQFEGGRHQRRVDKIMQIEKRG